jgi:hypothetical protein
VYTFISAATSQLATVFSAVTNAIDTRAGDIVGLGVGWLAEEILIHIGYLHRYSWVAR